MDLTDHFISPAPSLVRSVPKIIFLQRQQLGAMCGDAAFHESESSVKEIALVVHPSINRFLPCRKT